MEEGEKTFSEQLFVSGRELIDTVKKLIQEGNARSLVIWSEAGNKLLEIPLTGAVAAGGAAVILAPFLALLVGIAAWAKKVRVEIIRKD